MRSTEKKINWVKIKRAMEQHPKIQAFLKWQSLPWEIKKKIEKDWDKYYEDCWNSFAGIAFREQREAYKNHEITKVKEIADKQRDFGARGVFIKKTTSVDPFAFGQEYLYIKYREVCSEVNKMDDEEKDVNEIFYNQQ